MHLLAESHGGQFSLVDWLVVAAYLVFATILGARLAGKQATIRDFFLGGRKLPWLAICGSTIATEISATTFLVVPAMSFAAGGNFTYLQLAIGSILARVIVGYYFVPRYFEKEIYSPYDFVGAQLGPRVKKVSTGLFMFGAVLGQGARLFSAALLLSVIADMKIETAIWVMGAFSAVWAMIGGITMVIWTDVVQFGVLVLGAFAALYFALHAVPAPLGEIVATAQAAGKFQFFDLSTDFSKAYTLWCGIFATPFLNLAAFGTDQVMTQRMFCCRNMADARKATIFSSLSIGVTFILLLVGVALYVYFQHLPFTPEEVARTRNDPYGVQKVLPIFIMRGLPAGAKGLIVAAVFAAAISTLESALAALAQTTATPLLARPNGKRKKKGWLFANEVRLSKALVFGWAVVLCLMATACIAIGRQYANAVDLALALAGYTSGPLLGIFLLAFLPTKRDDSGLGWAVVLTVLAVFGMSQHERWADWVVWIGAAATFLMCLGRDLDVRKVAVIVAAALLVVWLHHLKVGVNDQGNPKYLAFPWRYPIATLMTFGIGYVLGRPVKK